MREELGWERLKAGGQARKPPDNLVTLNCEGWPGVDTSEMGEVANS